MKNVNFKIPLEWICTNWRRLQTRPSISGERGKEYEGKHVFLIYTWDNNWELGINFANFEFEGVWK